MVLSKRTDLLVVVAWLVAAVSAIPRLFPCWTSYIDPIRQLVAVFPLWRVYVAHDGGGAPAEEISWCKQIPRVNERTCRRQIQLSFWGGKVVNYSY